MLVCVTYLLFLALVVNCDRVNFNDSVFKRSIQRLHEKTKIQNLSEFFLEKDFYSYDPNISLILLLKKVAGQYFSDCTSVILYDNYTETNNRVFLTKFFSLYNYAYIHARIPTDYHMEMSSIINNRDKQCVHFIIFIEDVMRCQDVVSKRNEKVVVVAKSSQWRVQEYLSSEYSRDVANLLIIVKSDKILQRTQESPYILYSHKLFVDALGSSQPVVLTSWWGERFSRNISLFQAKMANGFSGHRFIVSTAHQPPFVIKNTDFKESPNVNSLGLVKLNFNNLVILLACSSGEAVIHSLREGSTNLAIGGLYITETRYNAGIFIWHGADCAAFISLASTALPRYRAIMGPFHWTVWIALIMIYMAAIFLFTYSDKATLKHLIKNPEEMENMFWYVFGTFTNCFTFTGKHSWTKASQGSTKILVGIYWVFTIIITACYTGSIIAFVTLPVFPTVVDSIDQLTGFRYKVGISDKGGWPTWFHNLTDKTSSVLMEKAEYVPSIEAGLKNITEAFFWNYAFLGSKEELEFIVKTNYSQESKRSLLHISQECFVPFKVGIAIPSSSVYHEVIARGMQMILESGLDLKIKNDIEWKMLRSATGRLLAANSRSGSLRALTQEDRALTLDDTQGMFLLLAFGFLAGGSVLASEIMGGCFNLCKKSSFTRAQSASSSIPSNPRFHVRQRNTEVRRSLAVVKEMEKISTEQYLTMAVVNNIGKKSYAVENVLSNEESMVSSESYDEEIDKMFEDALARVEDRSGILFEDEKPDNENFHFVE